MLFYFVAQIMCLHWNTIVKIKRSTGTTSSNVVVPYNEKICTSDRVIRTAVHVLSLYSD